MISWLMTKKFKIRITKYLSVFTPNAGKYRPENTPCLDTFHTVLFEEVKQTYLSLKSFQDTKIVKYFGVYMLLHYRICRCISGHSKFNMDWNLFFIQNSFTLHCWLLCLLGCLTYTQYWEYNNICNTWTIKKRKIQKSLRGMHLLK